MRVVCTYTFDTFAASLCPACDKASLFITAAIRHCCGCGCVSEHTHDGDGAGSREEKGTSDLDRHEEAASVYR